jgi:hypothetical protein
MSTTDKLNKYKIYWEFNIHFKPAEEGKPFDPLLKEKLLSIEPYLQSSFHVRLKEKRRSILAFRTESPLFYGEFYTSLPRDKIDKIAKKYGFTRISNNGEYCRLVHAKATFCEYWKDYFFDDSLEYYINTMEVECIKVDGNYFKLGLHCAFHQYFANRDEVFDANTLSELDLLGLSEPAGIYPALTDSGCHALIYAKDFLWGETTYPMPIPKSLKFLMAILSPGYTLSTLSRGYSCNDDFVELIKYAQEQSKSGENRPVIIRRNGGSVAITKEAVVV